MAVIASRSVILLISIISVVAADVGSTCTTPNNKTGTCIEIRSCKELVNLISTKTTDAINFARNSHCGFSVSQPLVCCGSIDIKASPIFYHELLPNGVLECGVESVTQQSQLIKKETQSSGISVLDSDDGDFHISAYGAAPTELNQHPWMALLKYLDEGKTKFLCGGTLISKRYVLTAAHCTKFPPNVDTKLVAVRLGEHTISKTIDCDARVCADPVVDMGIERIIVHPNYNRKQHVHDISLIRLENNVKFTFHIKPICLPEANSLLPLTTNLSIVGWGETEHSEFSDVKLFGFLPVVSPADCGAIFSTTIEDHQFCAGGMDNKDTCKGDSGGPALRIGTINFSDQWVQEGIVSYGLNDCGVEGYPGVYTRVSKYVNWIVDNMSE